jgi:hypothetical protein
MGFIISSLALNALSYSVGFACPGAIRTRLKPTFALAR